MKGRSMAGCGQRCEYLQYTAVDIKVDKVVSPNGDDLPLGSFSDDDQRYINEKFYEGLIDYLNSMSGGTCPDGCVCVKNKPPGDKKSETEPEERDHTHTDDDEFNDLQFKGKYKLVLVVYEGRCVPKPPAGSTSGKTRRSSPKGMRA